MDSLVLFALFPLIVRRTAGRVVARVFPVGRRGLHLEFDGEGPGLRLDTAPGRGVALLLRDAPPRVRGGRGAWPDVVAALDRDLAGRRAGTPRVAGAPPALEWTVPGGAQLHLVCGREGGALRAESVGGPPRTLPEGRREPRLDETSFRDDLQRLAADWRAALPGPPDQLVARLAGASAECGASGVERLVARARRTVDAGAALTGIAARLEGEDAPASVSGFVRGPEPPRASWRGSLRIELIVDPGAGDEEMACADLPAALELWYRAALAAEELGSRRDAAERLARRELEKTRRAVLAVTRDEAGARPAAELRRLADALLAAGPQARKLPAGAWQVPDPWDPSRTLEIAAEPPGASLHAAAARLYARARREERGRSARAARRAQLEARAGTLERLLACAASADVEPEIAALEEELRRLGVAAGRELAAISASRAPGAEGGGARLRRSPAGFLVLAGRSARQNDALTFRTAAPDDLWFHVRGRPGAHVVLRTEGKPVPEADQLFAAGLAASLSGVPRGEAVEVTVARRKHLRRPRGGTEGQVLVHRSETVRVRAGDEGPPPADSR